MIIFLSLSLFLNTPCKLLCHLQLQLSLSRACSRGRVDAIGNSSRSSLIEPRTQAMNSAGSSPPADGANGIFGSSGISGFGYGVGVSIGILLIVSTIALAVYFCTRTSMPVAATAPFASAPPPRRSGRDVEQGIDQATLEAFPAVPYAEARKAAARGRREACCPVCLESYADGDVVRALPDCGHLFHRECVDPWLRLRPTCPVCRTSPLPSPMPTPLAEVTPLASARPS